MKLSEHTDRAYTHDQAVFLVWCKANKRAPLAASPNDLLQFLRDGKRAGLSSAVLRRRRAACARMFIDAGIEPPTHTQEFKAALVALIRPNKPRPGRGRRQAVYQKAWDTLDRAEWGSLLADAITWADMLSLAETNKKIRAICERHKEWCDNG